jgi:hypothetical protein
MSIDDTSGAQKAARSIQLRYAVRAALSARRPTRVAGFRPGSRQLHHPRFDTMMRKLLIASLLTAGVALSASVLALPAASQAATPTAQAAPAATPAPATDAPKTAAHHKAHHKSHKHHKKAARPAATSTGG